MDGTRTQHAVDAPFHGVDVPKGRLIGRCYELNALTVGMI